MWEPGVRGCLPPSPPPSRPPCRQQLPDGRWWARAAHSCYSTQHAPRAPCSWPPCCCRAHHSPVARSTPVRTVPLFAYASQASGPASGNGRPSWPRPQEVHLSAAASQAPQAGSAQGWHSCCGSSRNPGAHVAPATWRGERNVGSGCVRVRAPCWSGDGGRGGGGVRHAGTGRLVAGRRGPALTLLRPGAGAVLAVGRAPAHAPARAGGHHQSHCAAGGRRLRCRAPAPAPALPACARCSLQPCSPHPSAHTHGMHRPTSSSRTWPGVRQLRQRVTLVGVPPAAAGGQSMQPGCGQGLHRPAPASK